MLVVVRVCALDIVLIVSHIILAAKDDARMPFHEYFRVVTLSSTPAAMDRLSSAFPEESKQFPMYVGCCCTYSFMLPPKCISEGIIFPWLDS